MDRNIFHPLKYTLYTYYIGIEVDILENIFNLMIWWNMCGLSKLSLIVYSLLYPHTYIASQHTSWDSYVYKLYINIMMCTIIKNGTNSS